MPTDSTIMLLLQKPAAVRYLFGIIPFIPLGTNPKVVASLAVLEETQHLFF